MIVGVIYALISMIGFGVYQVFLKNSKNNIYSSLIYVHLAFSLAFIPIILFTKFVVPDIKTFVLIIITSFVGAVNIPFLYKAIKAGKLSLVVPIANTYALPTVIFSFIAFGELLKISQYLYGIIIIIGVTLIVLKREEIKDFKIYKKDLKPMLYAAIFSIGLGVYSVLLRPIEKSIGPFMGFFYTEIIITIILCLYYFSGKVCLQKPKHVVSFTLAGLFQAVGSLFFFLAIKYSNVSITSMIGSANPLIVLVLAFAFFKERIEWNQMVGVVVTVVGLIGLGL